MQWTLKCENPCIKVAITLLVRVLEFNRQQEAKKTLDIEYII